MRKKHAYNKRGLLLKPPFFLPKKSRRGVKKFKIEMLTLFVRFRKFCYNGAMKITKEQKKELKKIALKYGLKLIILFGSFANGANKAGSDFDAAVSLKKLLSFKKELNLIADLSSVFKHEVDLSTINTANPLHLQQISKNGILFYGAPRDYFNFKLYAFHRYNDYSPYFKLEEALNKQIYAAR